MPRDFTVIGYYAETGERYVGHYSTGSYADARDAAVVKGVIVCAVIAGKHYDLDAG